MLLEHDNVRWPCRREQEVSQGSIRAPTGRISVVLELSWARPTLTLIGRYPEIATGESDNVARHTGCLRNSLISPEINPRHGR